MWHILSPEGHLPDAGREADYCSGTSDQEVTSPLDLPMQKFPPEQEVCFMILHDKFAQ